MHGMHAHEMPSGSYDLSMNPRRSVAALTLLAPVVSLVACAPSGNSGSTGTSGPQRLGHRPPGAADVRDGHSSP